MSAAPLNRKSRVGKATLTLHLAGELACKGNQFATFVVRPTTDMTTQERARIAAFENDVIVAETLRARLAREIPTTSGEPK
ncbi:hypothetical protein NKH47_31740 [Mesorhizobium sp. M1060]|uniref:hypothetical protein n=1 Tax=unclassified Mesorhizobium TaxID=325217 RepID=UPI0012EBF8DA|nr:MULTISPECIES: hypothetical protein [unclassified Mesorhizobium]WJI52102.1 hypothetical protein NLY44_05250 [Mesorhizobium sp. C089B]